MLKTLVKKQLSEIVHSFVKGRRDSAKNTKVMTIVMMLLLVYVYAVMIGMFAFAMDYICEPFAMLGIGWFYFATGFIFATVLGVLGTVFMAQSQLYEAKDNDLLLSMPIPPIYILLSRMISIYVQVLVFESAVLIPANVVWWINVNFEITQAIFGIVLIFVAPLLAMVLSGVLGWLVAMITSRTRFKNVLTIVLSLGFLGVYLYFYSQAGKYLQIFIANGEELSNTVKNYVYPIYQYGKACMGDVKAFVITVVIIIGIFSVMYYVLSKTFIKIATTKKGEKKVEYKEKELKVSNVGKALLIKEAFRFFKSPVYMMNCGLGTVFAVFFAGFIIIKEEKLWEIFVQFDIKDSIAPVMCCGIITAMMMLNNITAPSISLEGASFGITMSFPITGWQLLMAKLKFHILICLPALVVASLACIYIIRPGIIEGTLMIIIPAVFCVGCGICGLIFNILFPNFKWSNETVPVKQGMSVLFTMLVTMFATIMLVAGYILTEDIISMKVYMFIALIFCTALTVIGGIWLRKKGVGILETL